MIPSAEYLAIKALQQPEQSRPGDMWLCRRLGHVAVLNGHKRNTRRGLRNNHFYLHTWGKPSLRATLCDWRDNDPASFVMDPAISLGSEGEKWEYVGNIFDLLPYAALTGENYVM